MPEPTSPIRAAVFADLSLELATTRRVLDRVPGDRLGWRPHDKSMTLGGLATHIANLLRFWQVTLSTDSLDMATVRPPSDPPQTKDAILDLFDRNADALRALAETATDADLSADWSMRMGDRTLSTDPRHLVARRWGMSHVVHHRGQLTVYLRLLDVPVPPVYGPTADERAF